MTALGAETSNSKRELEAFQKRRITTLYCVVALLVMAIAVTKSAWTGASVFGVAANWLIELLAFSLVWLAIIGRLWATLYIGGRKSITLIQSGPYSVTRSPLYVFSVIGAFGAGLFSGSFIMAFVCATAAFAVLWPTAKYEERFLSRFFGTDFDHYKSRVPLFFPRWSLFKDLEMVEINPKTLYSTFFDGLVFLAAYPGFKLLEIVHDTKLLPVFFNLY